MLFSFVRYLANQSTKFKELIRIKMQSISNILKDILQWNDINIVLITIEMIISLCNDSQIREYFANNPYNILKDLLLTIRTLLQHKPLMWEKYIEMLLTLVTTLSLSEESHDFIIQAGLSYYFDKEIKILVERYPRVLTKFINFFTIMTRSSKYLTELLQADNFVLYLFTSLKPFCETIDNSIRILTRLFESNIITLKIKVNKISIENTFEDIKGILRDAYDNKKKERYANTCTLLYRFLKKYSKYIVEVKELLPLLIKSGKEDTGIIKKNVCTLLAGIAIDEGNKEIIKSLHGLDLIKDF